MSSIKCFLFVFLFFFVRGDWCLLLEAGNSSHPPCPPPTPQLPTASPLAPCLPPFLSSVFSLKALFSVCVSVCFAVLQFSAFFWGVGVLFFSVLHIYIYIYLPHSIVLPSLLIFPLLFNFIYILALRKPWWCCEFFSLVNFAWFTQVMINCILLDVCSLLLLNDIYYI